MATMAHVEAVAPPPAQPPALALTNCAGCAPAGRGGGRNGSPTGSGSGSGSGSAPALEYLMPGSTMHAADLGYPAEGRGGAPGDYSSSEEFSRRTEAEGGCLPASSSSSSTLEDFMTRRRQTTAGATPWFKVPPLGRSTNGSCGCCGSCAPRLLRPPVWAGPDPRLLGSSAPRLLRLPRARLAALGGSAFAGERSGRRPPSRCLGCSSEPPPESPLPGCLRPLPLTAWSDRRRKLTAR